MQVKENVRYDSTLKNRISGDMLQLSDHVLLSLANYTAGCIPGIKVYIGAQQQDVTVPAAFVTISNITKKQLLCNQCKYELRFEIAYFPDSRLSVTELSGIALELQQGIKDGLVCDLGTFKVFDSDYSDTDQIAHVTGVVTATETTYPDNDTEPMIQNAGKGVITKW